MDQDQARTLARKAGEKAVNEGCALTNAYNPSMAELSEQCDRRGLDIHSLFAR